MKSENKNGTIGKVLGITGLVLGGLATIGLIKTIKEYSQNVDDYNRLLDKNRELADFIDRHDFYEREDTSSTKRLYYRSDNKPLHTDKGGFNFCGVEKKYNFKVVNRYIDDKGRGVRVSEDPEKNMRMYEYFIIKSDGFGSSNERIKPVVKYEKISETKMA